MPVRSTSVLAATAFLALALSPARAASALDDLVQPVDDATACFTRVYDAAHLRAHPKQKITAMTVWLRYDKEPDVTVGTVNLGIALGQRGDPAAVLRARKLRLDGGRQPRRQRPTGRQSLQEERRRVLQHVRASGRFRYGQRRGGR